MVFISEALQHSQVFSAHARFVCASIGLRSTGSYETVGAGTARGTLYVYALRLSTPLLPGPIPALPAHAPFLHLLTR